MSPWCFNTSVLFPWKRLEENIAYGLELRGKSRPGDLRRRVKRYVALIGLKGFEKSYPHQLSGGMQQRAGLARAMAINPSVLLMDEPFGALDAQTRELMQEELLRILETERKTMIFVTHSIDEAIVLGDRIVVMSCRPGPDSRDSSRRYSAAEKNSFGQGSSALHRA